MPAEIKAIECPKCGSTQKAEIRPGDFRCESCGTEYFIDDGSVKFGQGPTRPPDPVKPGRSSGAALWIAAGLILGTVILIAVFASSTSKTTTNAGKGYNWEGGFANDLYLSADKRPVLLTVGRKTFYDRSDKNADFVAFNDARDGSVIALVPLPDSTSIPTHSGSADFDVQEFSNGDIFILVEKTQLFRVRKNSYAVTDVTRTLFEGQPELANGVARIEFIAPSFAPWDGEGFKLIANDGTNYDYYPVMHELLRLKSSGRGNYFNTRPEKAPGARAEEKDAFGFSGPWNSDFPDVPEKLIAFRYKVDPYAPVPPRLNQGQAENWDDPQTLERQGVVSHRDFTPGRIYFAHGVLYFDDDYVLISFRLTAGKTAPRYVQLLNAKTAAILFTTRLDVPYAPDHAIRYSDGFAILSDHNVFTLSLSGSLQKHTPMMYQGYDR